MATRSISPTGTILYRDAHGDLHREDGPAVEFTNGLREWWVHGRCARSDGPALEDPHGYTVWSLPEGNPESEDDDTTVGHVVEVWFATHHPRASAQTRDVVLAAARTWPYGSNLATLYAAADAATTDPDTTT